MAVQTKTRRIGRKRWTELVKFLTDKMKNAGSERVQMAAAQRLADILTLREQREQLELRRELRDAGKAEAGDEVLPDTAPAVQTAEEAARRFLKSIGKVETNDGSN